MSIDEVSGLVERAIDERAPLLASPSAAALRLFNGYTEGAPGLALDVYGRTLLVHDGTGPDGSPPLVDAVVAIARRRVPWLSAGLLKIRESDVQSLRNGTLLFGRDRELCRRVDEDGVRYAVRLTLNRDASLYLDTAPVRAWARRSLSGARVLNTFAYTGSLGAAARAGGASRVITTDLNRAFLTVAKDTWALNGWPVRRPDFITQDFFELAGALKREGELFDAVFVDPPFFSVTPKGKVDLEADMLRVLNKVRPLVADGGALCVINNGAFVSGKDFEATLQAICADGYATVETRIAPPEHVVGFPSTRVPERMLGVDPSPYKHSTKVAVLRVRRKDGKR